MGLVKEHLYDAENAAWEASPERRAERERLAGERDTAAARVRRESVWAARHPGEWEEWVRVQLLLSISFEFGADNTFDFDDFLMDVGHRPSAAHHVTRVDESKPYQQGNLTWAVRAVEPPKSPYLNVEQAAAFLGVAVQTVYNNRRHIPSLPGFRTLMFDRKVLEGLRASPRFMSKRQSETRRSR
ncbi:MAG: helix-turn-helix domain-containing protein [Planctomycetes bacterium]|nr:helix-turn-helix domain-containing protein [Planctomycetota bacterium]